MGSKGRIPLPHLRRPLPGPGMVHPDPFGQGNLPDPGPFTHFEMLPPPEIMEQKLVEQHMEMQRLGTENQRLATTHGTLRQELVGAQHELQILSGKIGAITSEREQQMRSLTEKTTKMEDELLAAEPVKVELQQAYAEAQNLVLEREELMSKVHQLNQDLQRAHTDVQQIPALMAELESLRQEYKHCRATFDYEKKFYNDHLESLQVMEENYMTMAREVEKLRTELMSASNADKRTVGQYGGAAVSNENDASGHPMGKNAYEDGYGIHQRHAPQQSAVTGANAGVGAAVYVGAQSGATPTRTSYEMSRGPAYDISKERGHDVSRGTSFESQRMPSYDLQRGPNFDGQRTHAYDAQRGSSYDTQRGSLNNASRGNHIVPRGQAVLTNNGPYGSAAPNFDGQRTHAYDAQRGSSYDIQRGSLNKASRGSHTMPHGQAVLPNNGPYGSATPPADATAYKASFGGGNPVRR